MSDIILADDGLEIIGAEIRVKSPAGETIRLSIKDGNLVLGGAGRDGDLMLTDKAGKVTIALNGERGALHLGGEGEDGDITVRDAAFEQTAHLDGRTGDLSLTGRARATSFDVVSDATQKADIAPAQGIHDALTTIQAMTYRLKERPEEHRLGLLAQDVQQALPEAVRTTDAGLALDQSALIAALVETVRHLSARIDALEA